MSIVVPYALGNISGIYNFFIVVFVPGIGRRKTINPYRIVTHVVHYPVVQMTVIVDFRTDLFDTFYLFHLLLLVAFLPWQVAYLGF
jgi:hypothetical protein